MKDYKNSEVYEPLPASAIFEGIGFVMTLLTIIIAPIIWRLV